MTDTSQRTALTAETVLAGLTPTRSSAAPSRTATRDRHRAIRGMLATVPIVLVGTMAVAMNVSGPVEQAQAKRPLKPKTSTTELGKTIRDAISAANAAVKSVATGPVGVVNHASAPTTYTVAAGDTVSSIAGRYGLSTASVLALNGLGWKSVIFPGQVLKLTNGASVTPVPNAPTPSSSSRYTIVKGDTLSRIAGRFGVTTQSILTANGLSWSSIIYPGQTIAIPGFSATASVTSVRVGEVTTPVVSTRPASNTNYTIVKGDTISSIAAKFGVNVQSVLGANGLNRSSVIYAGRTISIPGVTAAPVVNGITVLTREMAENARIVIAVGRELGVSDYGIVVALSAAMQESSMRNINYGDRDSLGLFQQRPSAGWGNRDQLLNVTHAARLFYGGPSNPNKGNTRGLLDISGWNKMTVTQAAQAVQVSAYPNAYAKWESSARSWLAALG